MSQKQQDVTFGQAGVIPYGEEGFVLLPLMQPRTEQSGKQPEPPLHLLPRGDVEPDRIAFTTPGPSRAAAGAPLSQKQATDWIASTHIFPSAYPRSHYVSTCPPASSQPRPDLARAETTREEEREFREADLEKFEELATLTSVESYYPPADEHEAQRIAESMAATSGQPQLWSCIERIVPQRQSGHVIDQKSKPVTLLLSHANGFHKEIWEPCLEALLENLESRGGVHVEEIWSLDTFQSGVSGTLNRPKLGSSVSWFDHARDMWQFLDYYLPTQSPPQDLANYGPKWPPKMLPVTSRGQGRRGRDIIGIGHSFGAATMHILNFSIGDLMSGHIIVDPIMPNHLTLSKYSIPRDTKMARGAVARKDVFTSRNAAQTYMASKPFFQAWAPRVLDLHVRFGLAPLPGHERESDPPVTLSMSKWSEAFSFAASFLGSFASRLLAQPQYKYRGWAHSIATRYAATFFADESGETYWHAYYARHAPRFTYEVISSNHLVVQEEPEFIGRKLAGILYERIAQPGLSGLSKGKL